jgi:hypothetical protein
MAEYEVQPEEEEVDRVLDLVQFMETRLERIGRVEGIRESSEYAGQELGQLPNQIADGRDVFLARLLLADVVMDRKSRYLDGRAEFEEEFLVVVVANGAGHVLRGLRDRAQ